MARTVYTGTTGRLHYFCILYNIILYYYTTPMWESVMNNERAVNGRGELNVDKNNNIHYSTVIIYYHNIIIYYNNNILLLFIKFIIIKINSCYRWLARTCLSFFYFCAEDRKKRFRKLLSGWRVKTELFLSEKETHGHLIFSRVAVWSDALQDNRQLSSIEIFNISTFHSFGIRLIK